VLWEFHPLQRVKLVRRLHVEEDVVEYLPVAIAGTGIVLFETRIIRSTMGQGAVAERPVLNKMFAFGIGKMGADSVGKRDGGG
jgi:hypothetical protein